MDLEQLDKICKDFKSSNTYVKLIPLYNNLYKEVIGEIVDSYKQNDLYWVILKPCNETQDHGAFKSRENGDLTMAITSQNIYSIEKQGA